MVYAEGTNSSYTVNGKTAPFVTFVGFDAQRYNLRIDR
jgi:hypothetical protein